MRSFAAVLRLGSGGAALGVLLGIFLGGLVGSLYGFFADNLEYGLNGALFGSAILGSIGSLYGIWTARQDQEVSDSFSSSDRTPATLAR